MLKKEPLLIAIDMDGTLLNSKKIITRKTLFLLRKLIKQGHRIVLSSGRPIRSLMPYYKQLGLDTPLICYNGAHVFSPVDPNFKPYSLELPKEMIKDIIQSMGENLLNVMVETDTEIWIDKEDKFLDIFFYYKDMDVHVGDLTKLLDKDTYTFICHTTFEYRETEEYKHLFDKYPKLMIINWMGSPYYEVHYKGISKGSGLQYVADYYNVKKENIIAFGDSTNDIEMFDTAGTSILMSNSTKNITNITMKSLKDNDHDGIYYTLKKLLKQF